MTRWFAAGVALLLLLTGCQSSGEEPEPRSPDEFTIEAERLPTVSLREARSPDAPRGFSDADVEFFAAQARRMMELSFDEKVARLDPDAAVDRVLRGLYATSGYRLRLDLATTFAGAAWQWDAATFASGDGAEARILRARWEVDAEDDRLDNGVRARVLVLVLQAHAEVTAHGASGKDATYVVRRTITFRGAKPRGGPDWWPAVEMSATTWGNNGCDLLRTGELTPARDEAVRRTDLTEAKASLAAEGVVRSSLPSAEDVRSYLRGCDRTAGE